MFPFSITDSPAHEILATYKNWLTNFMAFSAEGLSSDHLLLKTYQDLCNYIRPLAVKANSEQVVKDMEREMTMQIVRLLKHQDKMIPEFIKVIDKYLPEYTAGKNIDA